MLTFSLNFALAVAGVPTCESSVIRKRKLSPGWGALLPPGPPGLALRHQFEDQSR